LSLLLPIDKVYRGFGLHSGIQKIKFDPPEEYGESYEVEVNIDDNDERIEKYTALNNDIRKYNEWTVEQNHLSDEELFSKLPADGKVNNEKDLGMESKWYPPMQEYTKWLFVMSKASPTEFRESSIKDCISFINCKELYLLKEKMPVEEFVVKFNKMLFEYISLFKNEAEQIGKIDDNYIWNNPIKEFVHWFHNKGIIITDCKPLIDVKAQNKSIPSFGGLSPNSIWAECTITIKPSAVSDIHNIQIETPEYNEVKPPSAFGFSQKNNPDMMNQKFETLLKFGYYKGRITINSLEQVKQYHVSRLRKHLQKLFGIEESPISNYSKENGYKCAFNIRYNGYDEVIHTINKTLARKQDALEHSGEITIDPETGKPNFPDD
jgi:hypothetical protein